MLDPVKHENGRTFTKEHLRQNLLEANIIEDGPKQKTIHLKWEKSEEKVSIFPDSPILRIEYVDWFILFTDWPDWPKGPDVHEEQMFAVYGADKWHRTYDPADTTRDPGIGYNDIYFDTKESDRHKQKGIVDPDDGGSLNYKGHFIVGAYKKATGHGFARIVPVERTRVLVLWSYRAWEFMPRGKEPFTTYLFPVSEGEKEIIEQGKKVVDEIK